jgi:hypothetical protein
MDSNELPGLLCQGGKDQMEIGIQRHTAGLEICPELLMRPACRSLAKKISSPSQLRREKIL